MKKAQKQGKNEDGGTVLSHNITRLMWEKRLKPSDIYEQIGVTRQMIYDYMRGRSVPGRVALENFAKLLGVTVADLYKDKSELQEIKKEVKDVITTDRKYIQSLEDQIQLLKKLLAACEDRKK